MESADRDQAEVQQKPESSLQNSIRLYKDQFQKEKTVTYAEKGLLCMEMRMRVLLEAGQDMWCAQGCECRIA